MKQTHILFSLLLFFGSCINQKEAGNLEGTILSINTDDKSIITDSPHWQIFVSLNSKQKIDDKVLVSCLFSDTVFLATSTEKELFPYIILDFQDKGANTPQRLNEISNVGEYLKKAKQQKYIPGPSDLSIINDNLFFTLNGEKFYFARYDTKKDKITLHTKLMEGLPNIYKSTGRTGKEVIYAMDMPWLIEYLNENQEIKSDVINQLRTECKDENDNPVLFFGS